ncbi:hypothetical protein DL98DRAFT_589532 [Cadophora sp. DSE1049]|nr:hypothetical protein DL98DRAFT_589532 [Cadophora sp. DSE1049]
MDTPPSSPPMAASVGARAVIQDSPVFDASDPLESDDSHESHESGEEPRLPPHRDVILAPSNTESNSNTSSSDPLCEVDSTDAPTSPPPIEDQIDDEPNQLFLTRHRVAQNILRITRFLAAYPDGCDRRPRKQLAAGWKAMIHEAEIVFLMNKISMLTCNYQTFCRNCGWGPAKDDVTNTHPQTPAMLPMVEDLKSEMRAIDPMALTQEKPDAFKLRWWNFEGKYLEDNVGNACDGLPVFPNRDFSQTAGETDTEYESGSDQELYTPQYDF